MATNNRFKYCKGCNSQKTLINFSKSAAQWDGLQKRCKECNMKDYLAKREEKRAKQNEYYKNVYYKENKDKVLNKTRTYQEENRDKIREKYYSDKNDPVKRMEMKAKRQAYYEANIEKNKKISKNWARKNKERIKELNALRYKRYALLKRLGLPIKKPYATPSSETVAASSQE